MKAIFLFEFKYRCRRPATYLYFVLSFILAFAIVASPTLEVPPFMSPNAPYMVTLLLIVTSYFFALVNSAIVGAAIIRDFDHDMESIMFSTGVSKFDYLSGRFAGSIATLVVINVAVLLGIVCAFALGEYMPWNVLWSGRGLQAFNAWDYIQPFLLFSLPNLIVTSALFFTIASVGRNTIVVFTQGMLFLIAYQIAITLFKDLNLPQLVALLDPVGLHTFAYVTQYWTLQQQNTQLVPFEGMILYNRLLWLLIAVGLLAINYFTFSFTAADEKKKGRPMRKGVAKQDAAAVYDVLPFKKHKASVLSSARQILSGSAFYFKHIRKEVTFIAIVLSGMLLLITKSFSLTQLHGSTSYATTPLVLDLLNSFNLFLILLAIIYSGDLVWKERQVKMAEIIDSLPINDFVNFLSKLGGLLLIFIALITALMIGGIVIQTVYGYYNYQLMAYVGVLYGQTFTSLVLVTIASLCIHVAVNNKFLGYFICVIFFLLNANLGSFGIDHVLLQFASGSLGAYSEMNQFGHFVPLFTWLRVYWLAFGGILLLILMAFVIRGHEALPKLRLIACRERFTGSVVGLFLVFGMVAISSGANIYYNTDVVNAPDGTGNLAPNASDTLPFENIASQPQVVESNLRVDLYPAERDFKAEGFYYLKNLTTDSIRDIMISYHPAPDLTVEYIRFDRMFTKKVTTNSPLNYEVYELEDPLAAGDSVKMSFKLLYTTRGFKARDENTDIVFNGTYLSSDYFPTVGVRGGSDADTAYSHMARRPHEKIRFRAVVGTQKDQIAVAPGQLIESSVEGERKLFTYVSEAKISGNYAFTSALYEVQTDRWSGIPLEIYHHPEHKNNLPRMTTAMKDALNYCVDNFGPFPYRELKIVEVPGYNDSRQAFSGVIPFSEKLGFVLNVENPQKELDMCYYLTAHEVAKQWWGDQISLMEAPGNALLTDGLSQYAALMLLKSKFSDEVVRRFLKYEMDQYITGRTKEQNGEPPLSQVGSQRYIYNSKAALAFNLLQDFMGEAALNGAIRDFKESQADNGSEAHSTASALIEKLKEAAPDSMEYLVDDLFYKKVIFENKSSIATYTSRPDGKFEVRLTFTCRKHQIDSLGEEISVPLNDWIEVGVFSGKDGEQEKLIYLERKKITTEDNYLVFEVDQQPGKAGIDPLNKYIDKNSSDNVVDVKRLSAVNSLPF